MKTSSLLIGLATFLPSICAVAQSRHAITQAQTGNFLKQHLNSAELALPAFPEKATTSEQLLALAHKADVSLLADATFFSDAPETVALSKQSRFSNWLAEIAYTDNLTFLQTDPKTFLMWGEPDIVRVARSLVAEQKPINKADKKAGATNSPLDAAKADMGIDGSQITLMFADYLRDTYQWDGQSKNLKVEFKLSDLPPEDVAFILDIIRENTRKGQASQKELWSISSPWLLDEIWKNAAIGYSQDPSGEKVLAVHGSAEGRDFFTAVYNIIVYPEVQWRPTSTEDLPRVTGDVGATGTLTLSALEGEQALDVPISLDVTRVSLPDLLAELQKQSGVTLTTVPGLLADKKVTARFASMPLSGAMSALSDLYGVVWIKQMDGGYRAQVEISPAQVDVLQFGEYQWFRFWKNSVRASNIPAQLKPLVVLDTKDELNRAGVEEEQLKTTEGVKLSVLPERLQGLIRRDIQERTAAPLLYNYQRSFLNENTLLDSDADNAKILVQVQPGMARTVRIGVKTIETGPPLHVAFLVDGEEFYSFSIPGQKERAEMEKKLSWYQGFKEHMGQTDQGREPQ